MIGSFLTRGLMMVFGYAYPAYECYKTVEKNKPEIEKLRFWCQYWILVAVLTVCERIGDAFISWVPMYSEAKLAFFIYLWYPKTMGTTYVYDSFFRPYVAKHENEIDRNLLELRTRAGDMAVLYWQRAASYGQTRVFDILQYVAAQSTPRQRPAQAQEQGARARQAPSTPKRQLSAGSNHQPATTQPETEEPLSPLSSLSSSQKGARARQAPSTPKRQLSAGSNQQPATTQPETEEPLSPLSSLSSSQNPLEVSEEVGPSRVPEPDLPPVALNAPKAAATSKTSSQVTKNEAEAMQIEALPSSSANENANPAPKEMVMEETGPVTRAKSKRTRPGGGQKNA